MNTSLEVIISNAEVDETTSGLLRAEFSDFYKQAKEWEEKAKTIKVTDATQLREMKLARESRLAMKEIRTGAEKQRKKLKENSLKMGRAIDSIANAIKDVIEPIEEYLREQEEFALRAEAKRVAELVAARTAILVAAGGNPGFYNLGGMAEAEFQMIVDNCKAVAEAKKVAEEKAAAEKAAKENQEKEERERLKLENDRLRAEAKQREADLQKVRDEERAKAAKEAALAKAKADAELQRQRDEAKAQAAKVAMVWPSSVPIDVTGISKADLERSKFMSDEERIVQLVEYLERAPIPEVGSDYGDIMTTTTMLLSDLTRYLRNAISCDQ